MVRVPVFLINESTIYNTYGFFDIYHISLESNDVDINYAIYANNILVESCQIKIINNNMVFQTV